MQTSRVWNNFHNLHSKS